MLLNRQLIQMSLVSVVVLGATSSFAKLDTQKKKISYAIGQQIGDTIKQQSLDVDVDTLAKSIKDVLAGKKSEMTFEDMRAAMMTAHNESEAKLAKVAEGNLKKGDDFLASNKKKDGIKETPTGLQYKVIKEGSGSDMPTDQDNVVCHYRGTLVDGTEFDSSYARKEPAEFPVTGVIPGWTESLKTMKKGEKRQLFIPAKLAYGAGGRPGIPPNSVLVFDIELLEIKKGAAAQASKAMAPKSK